MMHSTLMVGLGNPGDAYASTRHNAGWIALDLLAQTLHAPPWKKEKRFAAFVSAVKDGDRTVLLAKPLTFMNESGRSVVAMVKYFHISPDNLWVFHDDLDIPLGDVRHSFDSRAAGHNGVQSIIDALGSKAFHRGRIGIKTSRTELPSFNAETFVLQKMLREEGATVVDAVRRFLAPFVAGELDMNRRGRSS